jgi:hypothetical protein
MRDFATIEDLIIPGDIITLDPEIERQIIEYMEKIHMKAITDEAEAIRKSKEILII